MVKLNLTDEAKAGLIEAINKGVEPKPDLLPKLFPGMAEKFDVQALDRAKICTSRPARACGLNHMPFNWLCK